MSSHLEKKGFYITIGSLPDREHLVATICYCGSGWAEINHEDENMKVLFYSHPSQDFWDFDLNDALEALKLAKQELASMGPKN